MAPTTGTRASSGRNWWNSSTCTSAASDRSWGPGRVTCRASRTTSWAASSGSPDQAGIPTAMTTGISTAVTSIATGPSSTPLVAASSENSFATSAVMRANESPFMSHR